MAFIDQEKAFDRVVRAELWKCLAEPIQCDIEFDGETLKQVEQFKYLGSIFDREGGTKRMSKKQGA